MKSLLGPILESTSQLVPDPSPGWLQGPFPLFRVSGTAQSWAHRHPVQLPNARTDNFPPLPMCLHVSEPKKVLNFLLYNHHFPLVTSSCKCQWLHLSRVPLNRRSSCWLEETRTLVSIYTKMSKDRNVLSLSGPDSNQRFSPLPIFQHSL